MTTSSPRRERVLRFRKAFGLIIGVLLAYVVWALAPAFVGAWWTGLQSTTRRRVAVGFLDGCLIAYGLVLSLSLLAGAATLFRLVQGRRRRQRRPTSARVLLLCVASLCALGLLEIAAWRLEKVNRPLLGPPKDPPKVPSARAEEGTLTLLVLGESSAEGQPFQPWYSIGHVIAWQLERARPGRKVDFMMRASGGTALQSSVELLEGIPRRPDVVVLCSGHNEFQARWGWARVVDYYPEDRAERRRDSLSDRIGGPTPFARLIFAVVERQSIDQPPHVDPSRAVVDRPVCSVSTRAEIRREFAARLEMLVDWCERAGAVPILVIPAGNDAGFDPDRSVLDPATRKSDRDAFARDFLAVQSLEDKDPSAAISGYRKLIARQPMFAEAHFRLAQRLQKQGEIDEAREHFTLARDLDGLPMRCPSDFQDVYRAIASSHPSVVLVDGPKSLPSVSPSKQLDDNLFHDGQHPSFRAYLALAQDALDQLRARDLFSLKASAMAPIDPFECAIHFGLDERKRWGEVCRRAASFWGRLASSRHDDRIRRSRFEQLTKAAEAIEGGVAPEDAGVPGLGINPPGFPQSARQVQPRSDMD